MNSQCNPWAPVYWKVKNWNLESKFPKSVFPTCPQIQYAHSMSRSDQHSATIQGYCFLFFRYLSQLTDLPLKFTEYKCMKNVVPSAADSIMEHLSFGVYRNGPLASPWTPSCPAPPTLCGLSKAGRGEEAGRSHQHSSSGKVPIKEFNKKVWTNQRVKQS